MGVEVDLLFLAVSPHRKESFLHRVLIYFFTFAMGQGVSQDIRSRLEHCTLEELLTDDKVISFRSLGELRRLIVT